MRSRKQELPADFKKEPLMYQGCSDPTLGPCDDIAAETEEHGIDLEMELGVITGDVPMGVDKEKAGEAWDGRRAHGPVRAWVNGELLGEPDAGDDMQFDFPRLIAHAAKTRPLAAGAIDQAVVQAK